MTSSEYLVGLIGLAALVTVVVLIVTRKKKGGSPSPPPPSQQLNQRQRQIVPRQGQMIQRQMGGGGIQSSYQGTGYLPPNTYSYTVIQPRYKLGMGSVFDSLQPMHSVSAEFAGKFASPETMNPRC